MKIDHTDDFKLKISFKDKEGEIIDSSSIIFNFTYSDCEGNTQEVSYDGQNRVNNVIKDGYIYAIFNSNTFQRGQLSVTRRYSVLDSDFQDGVWNFSSPKELIDIIIV